MCQDQEYQEAYNTLYLPPEFESNLVEAPVKVNFADIENIIAELRLKEYTEYLRNYETGKPRRLIDFSDGYKKALKDILAGLSKISA